MQTFHFHIIVPVTWGRVLWFDQTLSVVIELAEGRAGACVAAGQAGLAIAPGGLLHRQVHGQKSV